MSNTPISILTRAIGLLVALVAVHSVSAQTASPQSVQLDETIGQLAEVKFQSGHFLGIRRTDPATRDSFVILLNKRGRETERISPCSLLPDLDRCTILDAAINGNGMLVLGLAVSNAAQQPARVLMLYGLGESKPRHIVRTDPIDIRYVAVDEQDHVWVLGRDSGPRSPGDPPKDFNMLFKFSSDGRLVGSYLPRSQVEPAGFDPLPWEDGSLGLPTIQANQQGRLYIVLPKVDTFMEFDTAGRLLKSAKIPDSGYRHKAFGRGFAMQTDGKMLAFRSRDEGAGARTGIYSFGFRDRAWSIKRPVADDVVQTQDHMGSNSKSARSRAVVGVNDSSLIIRDVRTNQIIWLPLR